MIMGKIIVGGVIEKNGKFLLVQEAKGKDRGKWNIPAGHLDPNEDIFSGAKREIKEETGCDCEITGILQIGNIVTENDTCVSVIFQTNLLEENIFYDQKEILNVQWFSYEELLNMKNELRKYDLIIASISTLIENKGIDTNIIKIHYITHK